MLASHVGGGQPKIQLSAIMKILEFETLGTAKWDLCFTMNYKSNVNETYMTYVPPQHCSYTQNKVCQRKGGQGAYAKNLQKML